MVVIKPFRIKSFKEKNSINLNKEAIQIKTKGRHDPCVGIRAVPIAEAMINLVLMDHLLRNQAQCGKVDQSSPFEN